MGPPAAGDAVLLHTLFFPPISLYEWGRTGAGDTPPPRLAKGEASPHPRCQAPSSDTAGDGRAAIKPGSSAGPPRGAVPGRTGPYRAAPSRREAVPRRPPVTGNGGTDPAVGGDGGSWSPGRGCTAGPGSRRGFGKGQGPALPCPRLVSLSEVYKAFPEFYSPPPRRRWMGFDVHRSSPPPPVPFPAPTSGQGLRDRQCRPSIPSPRGPPGSGRRGGGWWAKRGRRLEGEKAGR